MKRYFFLLCFAILTYQTSEAQWNISKIPLPGYEERISTFIDSLRIIDTHEHLLDPEMVRRAGFLDFSLLFLENGYNDLVSSGMPDTLFPELFGSALNPAGKWKIIEPYWDRTYNTVSNRIILQAAHDLYGIGSFDSSSVSILSEKMKKNYGGSWFDMIMHDRCRIDYIVQDAGKIRQGSNLVHYAHRFNPWLLVRRKSTIDSLAMSQTDPIFTLDSFVKSMWNAVSKASNNGMAVIKINIAYNRSLNFEHTGAEAAKKVFRLLVNGNDEFVISEKEAKPLQDYMLYKLMEIAREKNIPVAFHTGLQSGKGNFIGNSNPVLLTNVFREFPEVNFVLFHGSYPYGGELSTLSKTFRNVYIDMNWSWAISPAWASRYLDEFIETVPLSKIMIFGGDERIPELTYASLIVAKKVLADVLTAKVRSGYFTEEEAKKAAKMLLYDNAVRFYKLM